MKRILGISLLILKIVVFATGIITLLFFGLVAIYYNLILPKEPEPQTYLGKNIRDWPQQFKTEDSNQWELKGEKIYFYDTTKSIGRLTLLTNNIPSSRHKLGQINASVRINGDFDPSKTESFYGFELGNKGALKKDKLIFGVNGSGQFTALNGEGQVLNKESFTKNCNCVNSACKEGITFEFNLTKNRDGWIIFCSFYDDKDRSIKQPSVAINQGCKFTTYISHIPNWKLSNNVRELSLVACNPIKRNQIWFKDLKVQNDWSPND